MGTLYFAHKWRRDDVDWGYHGVRGRLVGYTANYLKEKEEIDFSYNYYGFYFLYNNNKIVFTSNSWRRYELRAACIYEILKNHTKLKTIRWDSFSFLCIKSQDWKLNKNDMLNFASAILNLIIDNVNVYSRKYSYYNTDEHKYYTIIKINQLPKK